MTFPVRQSTVGDINTSGSAFSVTLPLTGNLAGDLMIMFVECTNGASVPSGWTTLFLDSGRYCWYRFCDGSETTPITVTLGAAGTALAETTRYRGVKSGVAPVVGARNAGASASAAFLGVTAPWGAEDNYFGGNVMFTNITGNIITASYPADLPLDHVSSSHSPSSARDIQAGANNRAASMTPGNVGGANGQNWKSTTYVLRPAVPNPVATAKMLAMF